jgi:hypothetical protein
MMKLLERAYVRWKVAREYDGDLWSAYRRQDGWRTDVVLLGTFKTSREAWAALQLDRHSFLTAEPFAVETRGPQAYAEPGIWA